MRVLESRFRSIALDLRGHGDSQWGDPGTYCVESYTADVNALIDRLPSETLVLVGHSLGAEIVTRIAALRPERVCTVVLVDYAPSINADAAAQGRDNVRASLRLYKSIQEYADWLRASRPLLAAELVEALAAEALRPVSGGFRLKIDENLLNSVQQPEVRDRQERLLWQMLEQISCPVLLVRGMVSALVARNAAARVLQTLRNGRLASIGRAGHAVMLDNPAAFIDALLAFVGDLVH